MKLICQKLRYNPRKSAKKRNKTKIKATRRKSFQKKETEKSARRKIISFLQKVKIKKDAEKFDRYTPKRCLCTINAIKTQKMTILKYRKPLASSLQKRFKIESFEFTHHHTSGNDLLFDFDRYITKYSIKSKKSAGQTTSDVRSIWMFVDPDMTVHPNPFVDNEGLDNRFNIRQCNLLIENKDKDPHEQTAHIQAPTIKSKLISFNRFIGFIEERQLYIGLTPGHLVNLRRTSNNC